MYAIPWATKHQKVTLHIFSLYKHLSSTTKVLSIVFYGDYGTTTTTFQYTKQLFFSVCILPMFHAFGLFVTSLPTLHVGGKIVTLPTFEPNSFLKAVENTKVRSTFIGMGRVHFSTLGWVSGFKIFLGSGLRLITFSLGQPRVKFFGSIFSQFWLNLAIFRKKISSGS